MKQDAPGRKRTAGKLSKGQTKGFHKMTEASRGKFMKAVFGKDGKKKAGYQTKARNVVMYVVQCTVVISSGAAENVNGKFAFILKIVDNLKVIISQQRKEFLK